MESRLILGYPNYAIYKDGRIYTHKNRMFIKPHISKRLTVSYLMIHLWNNGICRTKYVHQLIAEAFLPPPPFNGAEVRHLDGNGLNNDYKNLAWGSRIENMEDAKRQGRVAVGEETNKNKLSANQIEEIRRRFGSISTCGLGKELAKEFNVTESLISMVKNKKLWKHLQ